MNIYELILAYIFISNNDILSKEDIMSLDIKRFWQDDEAAHRGNCFSVDAPQVALGIRMSDECVFAELNEPGHPWDTTIPVKV